MMTISMVRNVFLGLIAFLVLWFLVVGAAWEFLYPDLRTHDQMPASDWAEQRAAADAELERAAAELRARDDAMIEEAKILAKELSAEPYMQPPYVSELARDRLAFSAALRILLGQCTKDDYAHWGWALASLPGHRGEYFTYCNEAGKPRIIYLSVD